MCKSLGKTLKPVLWEGVLLIQTVQAFRSTDLRNRMRMGLEQVVEGTGDQYTSPWGTWGFPRGMWVREV